MTPGYFGTPPVQKNIFRFAVISDPQIRSRENSATEICQKALLELGEFENRPAFVIATGDLVDGRSGAIWNALRRRISTNMNCFKSY